MEVIPLVNHFMFLSWQMSKSLYYINALLLIITVALFALFVRDISASEEFASLQECEPYNVNIDDIVTDGFTISWMTKGNCTGTVKYGEERDNISFIVTETGDSSAKKVHKITIDSLEYSTQYYLLVVSNQVDYGIDNSPLMIKTKAF